MNRLKNKNFYPGFSILAVLVVVLITIMAFVSVYFFARFRTIQKDREAEKLVNQLLDNSKAEIKNEEYFKNQSEIEQVLSNFLENVSERNFEPAYNLISSEFRKAQTFKDFQKFK